MRLFNVCVVISLVVLAAFSCDRKKDRPADELRFVNRGDIITLDLNKMSYLQDFRITYAIREGLYTIDAEHFKPLPALVVSEEVSSDKKTWTFKLRPEAKWSNGDPVTAADFVFSWRHLLESPGEYTSLLYYFEGAEAYEKSYRETGGGSFDAVGIKAIDPQTLQVKLNNPVTFFRDLMAFPTFYPRHAKSMEPFKVADDKGRTSYKDEYTRPGNVVTNGPFMLTKWEAGTLLRMEQNPHYWDRAALKLKAIENVVNNDAQSAFIQYEQKRVDWIAELQQDIAYPLKQQGRADLRTSHAFGTCFITVNCAPKAKETGDATNPLSDPRVREAISIAIQRKTLVDTVTRMGEKPARHYMPPGFFPLYSAEPIAEENIQRAKQLLAEAGFPDGKGFPTISLIYNSDNTIRRDLAASISNQLRQNLGIRIEGRGIELKTYRDQVTSKNYSMAIVAWYGDYMDPSTFTDKYLSNSGNNDSNWGPAAYDELLRLAKIESDESKRYAILAQAESMLNRELPLIPLYHYVNISLYRDNVKGLYTNAKNLTVFKPISLQ